jgi:hypothetical protein
MQFVNPQSRRISDAAIGDHAPNAMTLNRNIFWLGRQWAVTAFGVQTVDRKMHMRFDIEGSRIFEENLVEPLQQFAWFDADDFAEALKVARLRSQETPRIFQLASGGEK